MRCARAITAILTLLFLATGRVGVQAQDYVTRSEAERIARNAASTAFVPSVPAPSGPSADQVAEALLKKQKKEQFIQAANTTITACRNCSAALRAKKDTSIPKEFFAIAREALNFAVEITPTARDYEEWDLARQLDDAAYELRILILSLDK